MREIKFRGKRVDNGHWVYGNHHFIYDEDFYINEYKYENGNRVLVRKTFDSPLNVHWILVPRSPHDSGWDTQDTFEAVKVIPQTVGQYIGLSDKDGFNIYEGDIIMGDFKSNLLVGFNTESAAFGACLDTSMVTLKMYWFNNDIIIDKDQWSIIGNVHDNPELITPLNS